MINLLKEIILKNILFIKYVAVGGVNTIFGYAIYWILLQLNFNFLIASLVATIIGTIFNFFTFGRLVFKSKSKYLFYKFILAYGFRYLLSVAGIAFLHSYGLSYEIGGAIVIIFNALIGFFLNKNLVFKRIKK
tara:strand:+ start:991 stop:1389 length:399 start_codon:yes stop_codon:yes gene_type:complete